MSPPVERRGVSQLDSWFWCNYSAPVSLNLQAGGYQIDAIVGLQRVLWTIDGPDGHIEREAVGCGSEPTADSGGDGAAAIWTPNEPGESTIQLRAWWSGSWTLSYNYPQLGRIILGTYDLTFDDVDSEPFTYEVYEIQTVGVANP